MAKIFVKESEITVLSMNENDYISLTDIAKHKSNESFIVICNWMRNRNTIEYLGIWETLFNPDFKPIEFDRFKKEAGLNAFTLSPQKWLSVRWRYCPDLAVATSLNDFVANLHNHKMTAAPTFAPEPFRRPTDRQAALRQDAEPPIALSVYNLSEFWVVTIGNSMYFIMNAISLTQR
ncbi:MAG: KilA-N domain-containing protein [Bacteroidales bacterium]|nr:KilA-N domain-containing protein [Bacteroidales bacterium]